jgi:hypothetical protein
MKKSIQFTALFASLLILFFTACTKEAPAELLAAPGKYSPDIIETDETLVAFNDAMIRFDPLYLQVIFKETKTKEQIQATSKELLIELNKNATNQKAQTELTELYHFESFEALQKASDALTQNALTLKIRFFNNNAAPTTEQIKVFSEARKTFIKNKLNVLEKAKQKRATGLWNDMADEIERQFHYYTLVYNEEFDSEMNGGAAECNESCCFEYMSCKLGVKNNLMINIVKFSVAGGGSVSFSGALVGSFIPGIGTIVGYFGGGVFGGIGGVVVAMEYYNNELKICGFNYKACLERKKNN